MKVAFAFKEEIASGAFAVFAALGQGKLAQHNGPVNADLFTEDQADALVARVSAACEINPVHWIFDNGDPYKELRNLEDEYYARMVGE
jgi:hypothetical protein